MANLLRVCLAFLFLVAGSASHAQLPPIRRDSSSPWNGSWKLDVARSSEVASSPGVPQTYRLSLGDGLSSDVAIKWEIPELGEIVIGRTNGAPMSIIRSEPAPGLTLSVRKDGPSSLLYSVSKDGVLAGGGRMVLVDQGHAWIDLTWPKDRQDLAVELLYVKQ